MDDEKMRSGMLTRLRHTLQALAMPAKVQLGLFPDFVCKADELALDFGHYYEVVLDNLGPAFTAEQRARLRALDERLGEMSGAANAALWTEEGLHTQEDWAAIREQAREVLAALGWEVAIPPSYSHEYIGSRRPVQD